MARMPWFRLYSEARNDAKLRNLADDEHRVWFNLLCLAGETDTRGVIPIDGFVLAIEVAGGDEDLLVRTIDKLIKLRIIDRDADGHVFFAHFQERQYDKPSDQPERVLARVKRHRQAKETPPTPEETPRNADVTPRNAQEKNKSREEKKRIENTIPPNPPGGGDQPFDLLVAMCEEIGQDVSVLAESEKKRQLAAGKVLATAGATEDDIKRMVRWLSAQDWVIKGGGVDLKLIAGQHGKWQLNGKPDAPPSSDRGSPIPINRNDQVRRDIDALLRAGGAK